MNLNSCESGILIDENQMRGVIFDVLRETNQKHEIERKALNDQIMSLQAELLTCKMSFSSKIKSLEERLALRKPTLKRCSISSINIGATVLKRSVECASISTQYESQKRLKRYETFCDTFVDLSNEVESATEIEESLFSKPATGSSDTSVTTFETLETMPLSEEAAAPTSTVHVSSVKIDAEMGTAEECGEFESSAQISNNSIVSSPSDQIATDVEFVGKADKDSDVHKAADSVRADEIPRCVVQKSSQDSLFTLVGDNSLSEQSSTQSVTLLPTFSPSGVEEMAEDEQVANTEEDCSFPLLPLHHHQPDADNFSADNESVEVATERSTGSSAISPNATTVVDSVNAQSVTNSPTVGGDIADTIMSSGYSPIADHSSAPSIRVFSHPTTLPQHCANFVHSSKSAAQITACKFILKQFIAGKKIIGQLLELEVPQTVVRMLREHSLEYNNALLHIALEVLNNIIALSEPDQIKRILALDFTALIVPHVTSEDENIQEQAVWILDNLAAESASQREIVLGLKVLPLVQKVLRDGVSKKVKAIASKTLFTLTIGGCDSSNGNSHADVHSLLQTVSGLLDKSRDGTATAAHAIAVVGNIARDETPQVLDRIFTCWFDKVVLKIVKLLHSGTVDEKKCAVDTLSHLTAGTEEQINSLLALGLLEDLAALLRHKSIEVQCAACRCFANITNNANEVIMQQIVDCESAMPTLVKYATSEKHSSVMTQASYALMYSVYGASLVQVRYLVECGVVGALCHLLKRGVVDTSTAGVENGRSSDNSSNSDRNNKSINDNNNISIVSGNRLSSNSSNNSDNNDILIQALKSLDELLHAFEFRSDFEHVAEMLAAVGGWARLDQLSRAECCAEVRELAGRLNREKLVSTQFTAAGTSKVNHSRSSCSSATAGSTTTSSAAAMAIKKEGKVVPRYQVESDAEVEDEDDGW